MKYDEGYCREMGKNAGEWAAAQFKIECVGKSKEVVGVWMNAALDALEFVLNEYRAGGATEQALRAYRSAWHAPLNALVQQEFGRLATIDLLKNAGLPASGLE